jgi:hypothetical protein
MVHVLLGFARPCPIPLTHVQFFCPPINHNIMINMFHDCPQQNKSYPIIWNENSPFVLIILYYLWECNNKIIICNSYNTEVKWHV